MIPTRPNHSNLRDAELVRDELVRLYEQERFRLDFLALLFGLNKTRLVAIKNGKQPFVKAVTQGQIIWQAHLLEQWMKRGEQRDEPLRTPDGARFCVTPWARYNDDTCVRGHSRHPSNRKFDASRGYAVCRICTAERQRDFRRRTRAADPADGVGG